MHLKFALAAGASEGGQLTPILRMRVHDFEFMFRKILTLVGKKPSNVYIQIKYLNRMISFSGK